MKEQQYWNKRIAGAAQNPRSFSKSLNRLLHPTATDPHFDAAEFAIFFQEKVQSIRNSTTGSMPPVCHRLYEFTAVTARDVEQLLSRCPSKQCFWDPVPTWLVKSLSGIFIPILTRMINVSLATGQLPASHKHALVKAILKKPSLNPAELTNYRPVSNLPFVSKLLERCVASQTSTYLSKYNLFPLGLLQSTYRPKHSTETMLLKILNDALLATDRGMVTLVVLLDYTAAFDTVDIII